MECKCASFCAGIVDHSSYCIEARHACNSDDMTVVLRCHAGNELLHKNEMGDRIDVKNFADLLFAAIQYRGPCGNSCVIN